MELEADPHDGIAVVLRGGVKILSSPHLTYFHSVRPAPQFLSEKPKSLVSSGFYYTHSTLFCTITHSVSLTRESIQVCMCVSFWVQKKTIQESGSVNEGNIDYFGVVLVKWRI